MGLCYGRKERGLTDRVFRGRLFILNSRGICVFLILTLSDEHKLNFRVDISHVSIGVIIANTSPIRRQLICS